MKPDIRTAVMTISRQFLLKIPVLHMQPDIGTAVMTISRQFLLKIKNVSDKTCTENQNTF